MLDKLVGPPTSSLPLVNLRPGHINQLDSTVELGRDQSVYVSSLYNTIFLYHSSLIADCLVR